MKFWFTSDTHFGHEKVIEYCKRPFSSIEEMNESMIKRWNTVVDPADYVFVLGDFAVCSFDEGKRILKLLNGIKHLVRGNHDRSFWRASEMGFDCVSESAFHNGIEMRHIPWKLPKRKKGFCGHVHNRWTRAGNMINVGADRWSYAPVSIEELLNSKQDGQIIEEDMKKWRRTKGEIHADKNKS